MKTMQRYTITVHHDGLDTYPNDFKCWVTLRDNKDGRTFRRRGYGKFIGNFSPIWVSLHGKSWQLTQLERETFTNEDHPTTHP